MNYLKIDGQEYSVFAVCQAHQQLEHDYNVGGMLRERPSNQRRRMSTGVQLHRMKYWSICEWTNILDPQLDSEPDDDAVRYIYLVNVLKWGLPIDDEMRAFMESYFTREFLAEFPAFNPTKATEETTS